MASRSVVYMSQSEKQRVYVDRGEVTPSSVSVMGMRTHYHAARVVECPQNAVEAGKYLQKTKELTKSRSKCLERIEIEKHQLEAQYRHLTNNTTKEMVDSFLLEPGFRFKRNGDLRKPRLLGAAGRSFSGLTNKKGDDDLHVKNSSHSKVGLISMKNSLLFLEDKIKGTRNRKDLFLLNQQVEEIKTALRKMRHGVSTSPKSSQTLMSASTRGNERYGKARKEPWVQRLSRHSIKSNCQACDHRLKHKSDSDVMKPTETSVKRWLQAPSGTFLRSPDARLSLKSSHLLAHTSSYTPGRGSSHSTVKDIRVATETPVSVISNGNVSMSSLSEESLEIIDRPSTGKREEDTPSVTFKEEQTQAPQKCQMTLKATLPTMRSKTACLPMTHDATDDERIRSKSQLETPSRSNIQQAERPNKPPRNSRKSVTFKYCTEDVYHSVMSRASISRVEDRELLTKSDIWQEQPVSRDIAILAKKKRSSASTIKAADPSKPSLQQLAFEENNNLVVKVHDFLSTLPDTEPSIARWRTSKGQMVRSGGDAQPPSGGDVDIADGNSLDSESNCSKDEEEGEVVIASKVYTAELSDLASCRYLRIAANRTG